MAWGGARPGSGPKKRSNGAAHAASATARRRDEAPPRQSWFKKIRAFTAGVRERGAQRRPDVVAFELPKPPPGTLPPDHKGMAQDSNDLITAASAWAVQGIYNGAFYEGQAFLGYAYLAQLAQRPEYRRPVEVIATQATRKWIELQAAGGENAEDKTEKIKLLEAAIEKFKVRERFRELSEQDSFFGRAHLYIDTGATNDRAELKTPIGTGADATSDVKLGKGFLKALKTVEPVWCYPNGYDSNDPLKPEWYNPQTWFVQGKEIHSSRLLCFVAREVPDLLKPAYSFGGLAMTQMGKPYVDNWIRTRQSVSDLVSNFSMNALKTDLATTVSGMGDDLYARVDLWNAIRDNAGMLLLNKDSEDLVNVAVPLGTLDMLQAQSQEHMAAVWGVPLVELLGISPHGLNASSDGEIRTFEDNVHAYQEKFYRPGLSRVIDLIQVSEFGAVDPGITYVFVPLHTMTEKEEADIRKTEAETDAILVNDVNAISPQEVRARVAADPNTPYHSLDVDDLPEPPADPGQNGEGGDDDPQEIDAAGGEPPTPEVGEDTVVPFGLDAAKWSESAHPRGQPGNAGQFGPGGSGGGKLHAPQYGIGKVDEGGGASNSTSNYSSSYSNAPLRPSQIKQVGKQMGSNPGGVFEGPGGERFYVKQGKSKDHVKNELTAAALYKLAGAPTLSYRPVEGGGHVATRMSKLDKDNAHKFSDAEKAEAARDFVAHAWLANWDAVGTGGDNLGTVRGRPTALDLGGALAYRAQGAPKGKAFGGKVTELDTMRSPKVSPDAAKIFGAMTENDLIGSARRVTEIPDDAIRKTVEKGGMGPEVAETLIARKNDIAERVRQVEGADRPEAKTSTVTFEKGKEGPAELNDVPFTSWEPPEDWADVEGQADIDEAPLDVPMGKEAASGLLVREPDGRVWLIKPKGGYGGYEHTFPKGHAEDGLSLQANAIKEMYEETGIKARITGVAGDYLGDMTATRYYTAERESGTPQDHGPEASAVLLVPPSRLPAYLNRGRDKAIAAEHAHDEAPFEESKHPRDKGGKFSETAGSGTAPPTNPASSEASKSKKTAFGGLWKGQGEVTPANLAQNYDHVVSKPTNAGSSYRQMLAFMIKRAEELKLPDMVPPLKAKLGEAFFLAAEKATDLAYKADATAEEVAKYQDVAKKAYAKAKEYGHSGGPTAPKPSVPSVTKAISEQALKDNPALAAVVAASKAPATAAELDKAKKNVKLQLQYVPGAPQDSHDAQKLVDKFNEKYEGKQISDPAALNQKVADFKALKASMVPLMSAQQQAQAKAAAETQAKAAAVAKAQEAANAAASSKLKEAQQAAKAKNKQYMAELGISETEATGFEGLVEMIGKDSNAADIIQKFKGYQEQAAKLGYPISGFQYALIRNYINGGYKSVNGALRSGSPSIKQHVYARLVNNAIDKLPKFTGTVTRGTTLTPEQLAVYKPGHVVTEQGFTSTGIGFKFSGNVHYTIKANGMRGGDFSKGANVGEKEVLFKAKTMFLVHKVKHEGGNTYIEMEEVESHG